MNARISAHTGSGAGPWMAPMVEEQGRLPLDADNLVTARLLRFVSR
jgi:hypothetical protein